MKVLADTNILFFCVAVSWIKAISCIASRRKASRIILCDQNLHEFRDVLRRKAPKYLPDTEVFLAELAFELIPALESPEKLMDDPKDQPILNAAILAEVDIIVSGDKRFFHLDLDYPKTITSAE